jgi:hypothetical protein
MKLLSLTGGALPSDSRSVELQNESEATVWPRVKHNHVQMLFLAAVISLIAAPVLARMYEEPTSFSLKDKSQEQVERKILPRIDPRRLLAEDKARAKNPVHPGPLRFAVAADVAFNLDNSGTWQDVSGGRVWRLRIQGPGATSLNLGITRFQMPEGAKLWIYDPAHKHVEGPYTARHRSHLGGLWTPIIEGDEIVVEVFVPAGTSKPVVEITKANRGYRGFLKTGIFGGSEGTCETDVICPEGNAWRSQIRAICLYTINGTEACTGNLMNNTALDFRPFVLSANHCGVTSTSDATIVVFWNFQSATCGTHGPGSLRTLSQDRLFVPPARPAISYSSSFPPRQIPASTSSSRGGMLAARRPQEPSAFITRLPT